MKNEYKTDWQRVDAIDEGCFVFVFRVHPRPIC